MTIATHHDVVKMGHDEVGIVDMNING